MRFSDDRGVSRRRFIRLGAAGAAAVAAGCNRAARAPAELTSSITTEVPTEVPTPPTPPPPPRFVLATGLGAQSYSFRAFSFDDAIRKCGEVGLQFIEPFPGHLPTNSSPERLAKVQELLAASKVGMNAYGVCGMGKDERGNRGLFEFCKKVGIGIISANPSRDSFDALDKLVEELKIKVAIHNHGPGALWATADQMLEAIKDHHPYIGVCLDTGHLERANDDPVAAVRKIGARLHGLHLKDVDEQKHDVRLGKGKTDLVGVVAALREVEFTGAFNLEYEIDSKDPMPGLAESIACLRSVIDKVNQA